MTWRWTYESGVASSPLRKSSGACGSNAPGHHPFDTGRRMINRITLTNFLSYGATPGSVELQALNVIIGPNGSGKSNLIEALELLRAYAQAGGGQAARS